MALLTAAQRKARFKALGLGEYNKANIKKFQKKAFPNRKDLWDGEYGLHTDRALRHFYNCSLVKNFEPTEFRCTCGRCTGYPTWMKQVELKHLQKIRNHYGKPMTITSGLRCSYENNRVGGVKGSGHTKGYAADFYMQGVTDTVANRTKALAWIMKQANHEFTYGAYMKDSNGLYRTANGMGNAMHTETHKPKTAVDTTPTWVKKANAWAAKVAKDPKAGYRKFSSKDKSTHECLLCHPETDPKHKWYKYTGNCIWFSFGYWHHGGGLPCKCSCGVIDNGFGTRLLTMNANDALTELRKKIGLKDIQLIRNGKKNIPQSKMKAGDLCLVYDKNNKYIHIYPYVGNGYMIDCGHWSDEKKQIAKRKASACKVIIRYTGK